MTAKYPQSHFSLRENYYFTLILMTAKYSQSEFCRELANFDGLPVSCLAARYPQSTLLLRQSLLSFSSEEGLV